MRVLIGTYRKRKHIADCLRSVDQHLHGVTDLTFVDDGGDPEHSEWLTRYGKVVEVGGRGYTTAMQAACREVGNSQAFWLEEDFELLEPVHLEQLAEILFHRPYLAQIVLLRGPHFPNEHQHGGLIEALKVKGHTFTDVYGVIEHQSVFSANPSLWRADVWASGWPTGRLSEEIKGRQLISQGYRFGYLPRVRCAHHGERTGFGY